MTDRFIAVCSGSRRWPFTQDDGLQNFPDMSRLGPSNHIGISRHRTRRIDFLAAQTGQTVEYLSQTALENVLSLQDDE